MKRRSRAGHKPVKARSRKAAPRKRRNASNAVRRPSAVGRESEIARLTRELHEALEQQAATAEVLKVISASPGDLQPVFDAILENATRICEAKFGNLALVDGAEFRIAAMHGAPSALEEFRRRQPLVQQGPMMRLFETKSMVSIADIAADERFASSAVAKFGKARTLIAVPMFKEKELIGAIAIYRQEVRPFSSKQIELLTNFAAQAALAIENARLLNELRKRTDDLTESLEQQTATSEVFKVISSSPGDLQPVFNTMLDNATRICGAKFGNLWLREGKSFRIAATHGAPPAYREFLQSEPVVVPDAKSAMGRVASTHKVIQIDDISKMPTHGERMRSATINLAKARTLIAVPMLKENELIGMIAIYRQEVRPFGDKQIELVTNFAAQAVIAIENTRLLNELRQRTNDLTESLEQQTATSEVLRVISSSPGELEPVFRAMLENATRICEAKFGVLLRFDGEAFQHAAQVNTPPKFAEFQRQRGPFRPLPGGHLDRLMRTKQVSHTPDYAAEGIASPPVKFGGARSTVDVPMLKDNELIGAFSIYRQEVRPFTDKQIALLQNFAAQAVIAIENARLLSELRESLQQQTATADVLKVISSSPGELEPVFHVILENAARICEANFGNILRFENGLPQFVAKLMVPEQFFEFLRRSALRPGPLHPFSRLMEQKQTVHVADYNADPSYLDRDPLAVAGVELGNIRSLLIVPMLKDGELIGGIAIYRHEVRPFTDKQIALMQNFAAQAVIAIENTRLLSELRESLEQQTATSGVLSIISRSPGELEPVFQTILENTTHICGANFGALSLREGDAFRSVAMHGVSAALAKRRQRDPLIRLTPGHNLERLVRNKDVVHVPDLSADMVAAPIPYELAGARALLNVPLLKDNEVIGSILIYRREAGPFAEKQIESAKNFAAQAVIAIENTRLLSELRESLEQQTATADVLKVISSSPGDLQPVFGAMLENATRICDAKFGILQLNENGNFRNVAMYDPPSALAEHRQREPVINAGPHSAIGRVAATKRLVHIADYAADIAYQQRDPAAVNMVERAGARTVLLVPMLKDDEHVGNLNIYRQEVRPFTERQIELLQNFAAQAVIAIENTRLLSELRESLDQQTATAEVLRVISSSPGELAPVFQAMLTNAIRICEAKFGILFRVDGNTWHFAAEVDTPTEYAEFSKLRGPFVPDPGTFSDRILRTKQVCSTEDYAAEAILGHAAKLGGARSTIGVPMLKDDALVGAILIYQQEVRPFTAKQIALVENFAAQAVIAIENTRLLNELRESLEQQTATSDVLKVISRSTFDLQTVLDTLVESAARLCRADRSGIRLVRDGLYHHVASHGFSPEHTNRMMREPLPPGRDSIAGRVVLDGKSVHVADSQTDPNPGVASRSRSGNIRTMLGVPLLREGVPIGVLLLQRSIVEPFTDKEIALAETFADQAVIAIENVRLFEAEQQRTRELVKSLEDLRTAQDRLIQTEKLASLGQLTAGIAHEIKNPLNFVNNFSSVSVELIDELREALTGAQLDDKRRTEIAEIADMLQGNLEKVVQHGKRADSIVKNMLLHSREGSGERRPVDINALVEESLNLAYHGARAEKQGFNIALERSFDPAAGEVDLFPQEITRVLLNLISNGFYAATKRKAQTDGAGYEPTLTAATKNLGDRVEIRIRDNGTGIPAEVKEKMFNPFFTTKPAGEGTGLGLSISHDIIVKQHAGTIAVETETGQFTEFRIVLPRAGALLSKSGEHA